MADFDGVVLAGGAARRFGGADKTAELLGGRSLLGRAVQALDDAGAGTIVVVGPRLPTDVATVARLVRTREDPPGSGPGAAVLAGLTAVEAAAVVVLAADLPQVDAAVVRHLLAALDRAPDVYAVVATDRDGRAQWLIAACRAEALRQAGREIVAPAASAASAASPAPAASADPGAEPEVRGPSVRAIVARLPWIEAPLPSAWGRVVDVDTPDDLSRARLDDWARTLVRELDLAGALGSTEPSELVDVVLDLARDAAHTVARPAAPVTTFALGLALGLRAGASGELEDLRARVTALLRAHG